MSSKRIAINTLATYGRSVLAMGMALFSSRWVLNSLGQSDFGLYSVVGSIIVFIVFLNSVMAGSAARFFAFSMGQGDPEEVNHWFNAALSIHVCLAFVLVGVGWPVGETVVRHVLNIPPDRMQACVWVFRVSLLSAFVSMLAVPYVAMFTAKQHIAELAVWGLLQSVLSFWLAFSLRYATGDRLLFYTVGMVGIVVFMQVLQIVRAKAVFHECRIAVERWFSRKRLREMLSFCSWNLIGSSGVMFRDQGSAIILNVYFGTQVNAAYGIANQVSSQTNQLSGAMIGAFSPEITTMEGRGDRARMLQLANQANKFGTLLVMGFAVPLLVEMNYILQIWLKTPPSCSAIFCRIMLVTFILDRLTTGFSIAINAHGKIALYQATIGGLQLLTLPLGLVLIQFSGNPTYIGYAFVSTIFAITVGRALWARKMFALRIRDWLHDVVLGCIIFGFALAIVEICIINCVANPLVRLVLVCGASPIVFALGIPLILTKSEFQGITNKWRRKMHRVTE